MTLMKAPQALALTLLVLLAAGLGLDRARAAGPGPSGSVTFIAGEATRSAGGKAEKLALGSLVHEGDAIETRARTRLELKLPDKSVIRIGPQSKVVLSTAVFGASVDDRKVGTKLVVGTLWAKVARAAGGEARFEVQTENAVAGVRGTTFRVDSRQDRSCVVKVYSGAVAVAGGPLPRPAHGATDAKVERRQVAGPREVSREQWEKLVTTMMEVKVSADGTPSEPESFSVAARGQDAWEAWNQARDRE